MIFEERVPSGAPALVALSAHSRRAPRRRAVPHAVRVPGGDGEPVMGVPVSFSRRRTAGHNSINGPNQDAREGFLLVGRGNSSPNDDGDDDDDDNDGGGDVRNDGVEGTGAQQRQQRQQSDESDMEAPPPQREVTGAHVFAAGGDVEDPNPPAIPDGPFLIFSAGSAILRTVDRLRRQQVTTSGGGAGSGAGGALGSNGAPSASTPAPQAEIDLDLDHLSDTDSEMVVAPTGTNGSIAGGNGGNGASGTLPAIGADDDGNAGSPSNAAASGSDSINNTINDNNENTDNRAAPTSRLFTIGGRALRRRLLYFFAAVDLVFAVVTLADAVRPIGGMRGVGRRGGGLPATLGESPYYMLRDVYADGGFGDGGDDVLDRVPQSVFTVPVLLLTQLVNAWGVRSAHRDALGHFTMFNIWLVVFLVSALLRIENGLELARCIFRTGMVLTANSLRHSMMAKWHHNAVHY